MAENTQFSRTSIRGYAGSRLTIEFDNRDNLPHNVSFYKDDTLTEPIFVGEIVNGPGMITYQFTVPSEPGVYYFQCDIHPAQMHGEFLASGTTS